MKKTLAPTRATGSGWQSGQGFVPALSCVWSLMRALMMPQYWVRRGLLGMLPLLGLPPRMRSYESSSASLKSKQLPAYWKVGTIACSAVHLSSTNKAIAAQKLPTALSPLNKYHPASAVYNNKSASPLCSPIFQSYNHLFRSPTVSMQLPPRKACIGFLSQALSLFVCFHCHHFSWQIKSLLLNDFQSSFENGASIPYQLFCHSILGPAAPPPPTCSP